MNLVISASELQSLLGSQKLLLVDTRPFTDYAESHIPGAVNIDLMQFHWIDTSRQGIAQFDKQSKILLSNIGVSKNKFVVFYDNASGPSAARGVWLLLYFSHEKVSMLDGGFTKWKAEEHKTETKTNPFTHSNFNAKPNRKILADFAQVKLAVKRRRTIILDTRSKAEYEGSIVRAARAGHIPTAINIDWNYNLENHTFKDLNKLVDLYGSIPKDAQIITYCQGGYRAANSFIILKTLGYNNVRMYLGSWGEWGNKREAKSIQP